MKLYTVRLTKSWGNNSPYHVFHIDVIAKSIMDAIVKAKKVHRKDWRWIDSFDHSEIEFYEYKY